MKYALQVNEEEASLFDVLWLLLASVIFVPIFQKIPGGSPVLGYLAAGVLIGPYALSIIKNVHGTKMIAEFGVVFLLFNIGLELSLERLSSMKKYVFGLGSAQVCIHPFSMHHATSQYFISLSQHIGKGLSSFQFGKAHSYIDGLLSLLISACL
jgi:Kef-type K+ transport system membrane component KefB